MGDLAFEARLEDKNAPKTVAVVRKMLPLRTKVIHCRWSGESTWIPMGDLRLGLEFENHTSHPAPGMLLLYPGGISETEMLFPYGSTMFAVKGQEHLSELGWRTLWQGAQDIVMEEV